MKDWLLKGAIETAERWRRIWRARVSHQPEQPVGAGKQGGLQKRGQASPDDGDALALTFAQTVAPREAGRSRFAPNRRKKSATKTMNSAGIASTDPDPERGFDEAQIPQAPIRRFTEA
jgi:hypothetical protein